MVRFFKLAYSTELVLIFIITRFQGYKCTVIYTPACCGHARLISRLSSDDTAIYVYFTYVVPHEVLSEIYNSQNNKAQ